MLTFNDLTVDPVSHRVWRGDVEIALSVKEFALLEYLMRDPGTVRTRTEILDHVWDFAYDGVPTSCGTSGICAARSTAPSAGTTCRPSAGAATAWADSELADPELADSGWRSGSWRRIGRRQDRTGRAGRNHRPHRRPDQVTGDPENTIDGQLCVGRRSP